MGQIKTPPKMIPYQIEKIENAICFFAFEQKKKTKKSLHQTFLYKYLAFFDFECLKETGRPSLGLKYRAMPRGPVPIDIYNKRRNYKTPLFVFQEEAPDKFIILPKNKPDLRFFSKYEIGIMKKLIEIYADSYITTNLISDASHEAIEAWKKTWKKKPNDLIDYISTFSNEILTKTDQELTYPEESYLTHRALEQSNL